MGRFQKTLLIAILGMLPAWMDGWAAPSEDEIRGSIVKIYTVHNQPNYYNPWSMYGPRSSTGSGCVMKGNKILTNAHVVSDQTFIQVRRDGESKRVQAHLLAVSHEADLALLEVEDASFFDGVTALDFGAMPRTQQEVVVYGFPLGGDTLSITKGVLSRIEHQTYAHGSCVFLAGQIDAAINPGNSGGPVIVDGSIVGVVMQSISKAENIGYMVPPPIIRHFLADLQEDGDYDGFPSLGVTLQDMENPTLKEKFGLKEADTGALVVRILHQSPAESVLQVHDVILEVDGHKVAGDQTIEFRPRERTHVSYLIQEKQIGESLDLIVLRDGKRTELQVELGRSLREDWLVPMEMFDRLPSYFIYGGVVFCPLSRNLLKEWGNNWYNKAPKEFVALLRKNFREEDLDEVVIVLKVLAADVNEGYHNVAYWPVDNVNGVKVENLRHLIEVVERDGNGPYIEIQNAEGNLIVLDRKQVDETQQEILNLYRVTGDRSPDLHDEEEVREGVAASPESES